MRSRLSFPLVASAVVALSIFTPAVRAAVQDRITKPLTTGGRTPISGTVNGRTKHSTDLGAVSADQKLTSLSLRFSMTTAQQADLAQLQSAQLNPSSSSYHQWLTPEQFGARFGLSAADLSKVSSWLTSQGLTVTGVARSSTFINFSGTAAQVQRAFGTTLHSLSEQGVPHVANLTDPTVPSGLAAVVNAVTGLNDFHPRPHLRQHPLYTQTLGGTTSHYIAPADLYTIYDFPNAYNTLFNGSSKYDGTGVTIAVMGDTELTSANTLPDANITTFRTAAGLPTTNNSNLTQVLAGGTNPGLVSGDVDEAHLDLEWSGAAAPGASIIYVYGSDPFANSLTYAVDNSIAPIITTSFGDCESAWGASSLQGYNSLLAQANVEGITVFSASGDDGATDCDTDGIASEGLNVDFPASSPFVTAAGGTMFSGDVSSPANYWNSSNTTSGGSVLKYIPEEPWNETTAANGLSDGGAGGGGASAFFTKPSWQTGTGVPADSSRDVPDIALNAAANHDGYMICTTYSGISGDEPCNTGSFLTSTGAPNIFGGTSFVAPITAGVLALVEQKLAVGASAATGLGNINPTLYGLANGPNAASVFHDITSGNNSVECSQGTPNCPNGGVIGFDATVGYDQASGIGSFDVNNLVTNWASATPTGTGGSTNGGCNPTAPTLGTSSCITTIQVTATNPNLCAIAAGSLSVSATVTGIISGTVPTGTVQFLVTTGSTTQNLGTPQTLVNGVATLPAASTSTLTSGGQIISAAYLGDANYAGSKGTVLNPVDQTLASVDIVNASTPDFSITQGTAGACSGAVTVQPGATASGVVFTVTSLNGFAGAVNMTFTNNSEMTATPSFSVWPVTLTSGSSTTTSFVVVASQTTTIAAARRPAAPHRTQWYAAGSGATLACIVLFMAPRRRRWSALLVVLFSIGAMTAIGCGGNTSTTGGNGGSGGGTDTTTVNAQSGTYTFTVTGVSGGLVHSTQVTVTVP